MQVQIVRASTRHRALAEAKRVIGPDPLVLSVRRRTGGAGEEWEAIVARDTPEPLLTSSGPSLGDPAVPEGGSRWEEVERFRLELSDFRERMKQGRAPHTELLTLAHRLTQLESDLAATALKEEKISARWAPLVRRLESAGYPRVEALRLVFSISGSTGDSEANIPDGRIREVVADGVEVAPAEERLDPGLVVFIGGAGVGKTTLAAKLAADLALGGGASPILGVLRPRKGVGLETVRRCASALDIDFVEVSTPRELAVLSQRSLEGPVILDSPSVNPLDESGVTELKEMLSLVPNAEVHTVVSTCYGEGEVSRAVDAFAWAPKRRLSATHLDEAPYVGRVMAAATRSRIPIGYLSLGPRIPDDLARPGLDSLVDSVLRPEGGAAL